MEYSKARAIFEGSLVTSDVKIISGEFRDGYERIGIGYPDNLFVHIECQGIVDAGCVCSLPEIDVGLSIDEFLTFVHYKYKIIIS